MKYLQGWYEKGIADIKLPVQELSRTNMSKVGITKWYMGYVTFLRIETCDGNLVILK